MSVESIIARRSSEPRLVPEQAFPVATVGKRRHRFLAGLAAASLGLASIGSAEAQVWGVNIDAMCNEAGGPAPIFTGQGILGTSNEVWNGISGGKTTPNLLDNAGGQTSISININKSGGWNDTSAANTLLQDWIKVDNSTPMDIVVSGLNPAHTYNIVTYSSGNQGASYQAPGDLIGECVGGSMSGFILGNNYLTLTNFTPSAAGTFSMHLVTNSTGWSDWNGMQIERSDVIVKVPELTSQPQSQWIRGGRSATLSVGVDAGGLLYFSQWYLNGTPIPLATSASLTLSNFTAAQAGNYIVVVTNLQGSVTSQVAVVTGDMTTTTSFFVGGAQGKGLDLHGSPSSFVLAEYYGNDAGPLQIQDVTLVNNFAGRFPNDFQNWGANSVLPNFGTSQSDVNAGTIANTWVESTTDTLSFSVPTKNGQAYKLQLLFHDGAANSRPMSVTIGTQVVEASITPSALGVSGSSPKGLVIGYFFTGTGTDLPITVVGLKGAMAGPAELNALTLQELQLTAPYLALAPQDQTAMAGSTVTFGALAGGSVTPFHYQWSFAGTPIPGETNSTLSLVGAQDANAGAYSVTVSNSVGSASASANLTVNTTIGVFDVTGPAPGQGLDLAGDFAISEYYGNTNGPALVIGGVNFVPSYRALGNNGGPGTSPNFGKSPDQVNLALLSNRDVWQGNPCDFVIPTTIGTQYKLQLIFHDNDGNKAIGGRTLTISVGGTQLTTIDCAAHGANVGNAKDIAVVYYFTPTASSTEINITSSSEPIISALTLEDLSSAPVAPTLLAPLLGQMVFPGAVAQLSVNAGGAALSYQWQKQSGPGAFTNLVDGGNVSGSLSSLLTLSNASASDVSTYRVMVWNTAGSTNATTRIGVLVPQPHSIIGHWLSGVTNLTDSSGYAPAGIHDGLLVGGTQSNFKWAQDVPFTFTGYSADLTAGNVAISIQNSMTNDAHYLPTFDSITANGFSIALYAKGWPGSWNAFASKNGEAAGFQLRNNGNNGLPTITLRGTKSGNPDATGTLSGSTPGWHHYAATWDGVAGVRKLYVDNHLSLTVTNDGGPITSAALYRLMLGARNNNANNTGDAGSYGNVKLFDVQMYGYALTTNEILAINQMTNPAPVQTATVNGVAALVGGGVTINVASSFTGNGMGYQWQKLVSGVYSNLTDGPNIIGSGTGVLILTNLALADAGTYNVHVTNVTGWADCTVMVSVYPTLHTIVGHWLAGPQSYADASGFTPAGTHDGWLVGGNAGSVTWSTTDLPPHFTGSSLDLSVNNAGLAISNSSTKASGYAQTFDSATANAGTITIWAKGWPIGGWNPWISKRGENNIGWQVRRFNNTAFADFTVGGNNLNSPVNNDTNTVWHHYAATYDAAAGLQKLYVDNVLMATRTGATSPLPLAPGDFLVIGGKNSDGNYGSWCGVKVCDARIYGYALTTTELSSLVTGLTPAPNLITKVVSHSALAGTTATMVVAADGVGVTYQWQKYNGSVYVNLTDGGNISGSASSVLSIAAVSAADAASYNVVISSAGGTTNSAGTLTVLSATTTGLLGHWMSGAANLADAAGYAPAGLYDGFAIGTTANLAWTNDVPANFTGSSLNLSAGNVAVAISNTAASDAIWGQTFDSTVANKLTIAFWAKGYPATVWNNPFVSKNGETGGYQVRRSGGTNITFTLRGTSSANPDPSSTSTNTDGGWHHYAASYDGVAGIRQLYIDNVRVVSVTNDFGPMTTSSSHLVLGGRDNGGYGNYYAGLLYDVRIYGSSLSLAQVQALNGLPLPVPPTPIMTVSAVINGQYTINWNSGTLQSTTALNGTNTVWVSEPATGSLTILLNQTTGNKFYRVVAQ